MKPLNYITPSGLKLIQDELTQLLHVERPQLVKTVAWAAGNGDRSENADYIYGKRRMREIDKRIHFLQSRLDNIEVVDPAKVVSKKINFGATVTIEDESNQRIVYQIVGEDEIDVAAGRISWKSPLAKALLGKAIGETAVVKKPKGDEEIYVVSIQYI